jgi:hypothetical protein
VSLKTVRNSTHKVVGVQIIVTYQTAEGGTFTAPLKNIDAKLAKQLEAYAWKRVVERAEEDLASNS